MQLKIRRSTKETGMLTKATSFVLDARVEYSAEEQQALDRFKWTNLVLYDSEVEQGTKVTGRDSFQMAWAKGAASAGRLKIKLTPSNLKSGHHYETTDLSEAVLAEEQIIAACQGLRNYFSNAKVYDGSETVLEIAGATTKVAA